MKDYKTIEQEAFSEFIEKKSRFIGYACPASTENEALDFVNRIRKKHQDAKHNVYAYVVRENNIQRFSDDGEPQGTAGIPVLDTIKKQGLTDIAVVVTRYFGGILLGGGGLVRAYGHSASIGIEKAHPVFMRYSTVYEIHVDYHLLGKIEYELRCLDLTIEEPVYETDVKLNVCVLSQNCQQFESVITEAAMGRAGIKKIDERYVAYDNLI
ncbi:MAG: YigZ family protein [Bacillota bacterium]|nr:YigZ family protein [Bacillota bacterium]